MRGPQEKSFNDRLADQAKARTAQLERARAKSPANDPEFAKRQAERKRIADERDARVAARAADKAAEMEREAARKTADALAKVEAERLEAEEREKAKRAESDKLVQLLAEQKANRDARYAARKAKKR